MRERETLITLSRIVFALIQPVFSATSQLEPWTASLEVDGQRFHRLKMLYSFLASLPEIGETMRSVGQSSWVWASKSAGIKYRSPFPLFFKLDLRACSRNGLEQASYQAQCVLLMLRG